jgi:uncharacterized RDD family membrane protein YckC
MRPGRAPSPTAQGGAVSHARDERASAAPRVRPESDDASAHVFTLHARHSVRTPEGVSFDHTIANLGTRFAAWCVDQAVSAGLVFVGLLLFAAAQSQSLNETRVGFGGGVLGVLGLLVVFGAQWAYFVLCEWTFGGQTLGKRLFHLRVVGVDGIRITFAQSVARNLLRMLDSFPVAALLEGAHPLIHLVPVFVAPGALCAFLSSRAQRIGDIAAGTLVIEEDRRAPPDALGIAPDRHGSFLADARLRAELSRQLTPAEVDALVTLCVRRDALEMRARLELFHAASRALESRLGVPRPAELSEEKFVLGVCAVLLGAADPSPPSR